MAVTATMYQNGITALLDGSVETTDTFKMTLHTSTYAPNQGTHAGSADLTNEVANANGYTTGGITLASISVSESGTTIGFMDSTTNPQWTASGGSITARYAVIEDTTTDDLICWIDFGQDETASDGNTFTVTLAADGFVKATAA
jgi:hypothetical protein